MRTLDEKQRATLMDRLFRRIGKLDDESLLRLEAMTRPVESGGAIPAPEKAKRGDPEALSRRYFITAILAGGILAASAGGAAAVALEDENVRGWLREEGWLPTPTEQPPTSIPGPSATPTLPAEAPTQITTLQNQLTSVIQERDGYQQQLTQANSQLGTLQSQLGALQTSHDLLSGLVDLYKQLDSTNLDQVVIDAMGALALPILAIDTVRIALNEGVILTVKALQAIEDQMPLIAAGLDWLEQQVLNVSIQIRALQTALNVSNIGDFTKGVTDFVSQVLDMLPFGAGQNVKLSLQVMGNVINQLPDLINNIASRMFQPARMWIVSGQKGGLYDSLLTPVRQQMLIPSQQMVANAQNLNSVYNTQLAQPAQAALDQRAKIRAEITRKAGALS